MPRRGPVLIIANHEELRGPDPDRRGRRPAPDLSRPQDAVQKHGLKRRFLETVNVVPIDQEGVGKEGIRNIIKKLQAGHAVLVFPEG